MNPWYLLYCKRSEQQRAEQHLKRQGVDCYYPQVTVEKIRRGKRTCSREPLFPNYIFASFKPELVSFTTVRSTRGVVDFVKQGATPVRVPFDLICYLMSVEDSDEQRRVVCTNYRDGEEVEIVGGQFAGAEAFYKEPDSDLRSILLIKLLSHDVEIIEDNSLIRKKNS